MYFFHHLNPFKPLPHFSPYRKNGVVHIDTQKVVLSSDAVEHAALVLQCMREELDDHRLAINENTSELESTSEVINDLGRKLDKLYERVDELTLLVKGQKAQKTFDVQPLTSREKEVFHALYVLTQEQPYASYEQLARKTKLSKDLVATYVTGLVQKGVPVLKRHVGLRVFVGMDPAFKELQAKKNIVGLNAPLTCWIQ